MSYVQSENKTKFSIIVPVYNAEKYLSDCVLSIIGQTYKNFELILVDDGSPDSSPLICDEFANKDDRIRVVHKKNGGQTSAREAGLDIAVGDYVVFVDSDDWIDERYLEIFEEAISKENYPDVLCCGYYRYTDGELAPVKLFDKYRYYTREDIVKDVFPSLIQANNASYFTPCVWAKAFRREIISGEHFRVDRSLRIGEDSCAVIATIYRSQSIVTISELLYYYRINHGSVTNNKKSFDWYGPRKIYDHITKYVDVNEYDFKEQLYRKVVHELFTVVVSRFYQDKPKREIKKEILSMINEIEPYDECIQKCKFGGSLRAKVMEIALKKRLLSIISLFAKIK